MAERRMLTFARWDAPYESARTTTALRLIYRKGTRNRALLQTVMSNPRRGE
jgi:hypothetical protein